MDLYEVIKKRRSVRRFSDKTPDWRKVIQAVESARWAPTADNMPTTRFVLIDDADKIQKIKNACQQDFVGQAKYILVVASDTDKLKKYYNDKLGEAFARQQTGAAIQNVLLRLTDLGIASCWVGLYAEDQVRTIAKIPEWLEMEAVIAIGMETKIKTHTPDKPDVASFLNFNEFGYYGRFLHPRWRTAADTL